MYARQASPDELEGLKKKKKRNDATESMMSKKKEKLCGSPNKANKFEKKK